MKRLILFSILVAGHLANAQVAPTAQDIQQTSELLATTTVSVRYNYCKPGTVTCRQVILYKGKSDGKQAVSFSESFVSLDRSVGSIGYFLDNQDGTLRAVLRDGLDGGTLPNKKFVENQNLSVTYDVDGFPTIHGLQLFKLGTTHFYKAEVVYTSTSASIVGFEYDTSNPAFKAPYSNVYDRIK